jgi:biotin synthase
VQVHNYKELSEKIASLIKEDPQKLFELANKIRIKNRKNIVSLCAIVNAKSGLCAEDCIFCSQSIYHKTDIARYPFLTAERILKKAKEAASIRASCFGIVISGRGLTSDKEISIICSALQLIKQNLSSLHRSASLGIISKDKLLRLKKAGLECLHHNLETSEGFFPNICTTHSYKDRLDTIKAAKEIGLEVCSGGIFGLGENIQDRIALAFAIKELDVASVPLNFLTPIKGTRCETFDCLAPIEILKTIAIFRILLPDKDIKVCGGRNVNLRSLQSMIFYAGASGMMIGNYLTTAGNDPKADLKMIEDLGLRVKV